MLMIEDILVSDDVVTQQFICNLDACKGACCWEGDSGAPLEAEELRTLERIYDEVRPFLSPEGRAVIEAHGPHAYYGGDAQEFGTPLVDNGPCAYMTYDNDGVAQCGIELAYKAGATDFKKPISCHLYPIRVIKHEASGMEALNYDRWDICSAACELGKAHQVPVYRFLKDAITRKYGAAFFEQLDAAARELPHLKNE
ncbi:MAG: DUF3109 family protein [Phaeodactylibacter sp.]|uniref:DUF3109 family protein n=1 Tax=Phaeodactylibacter sp. TaxID=1940289 RepID=UPI0032EC04DD